MLKLTTFQAMDNDPRTDTTASLSAIRAILSPESRETRATLMEEARTEEARTEYGNRNEAVTADDDPEAITAAQRVALDLGEAVDLDGPLGDLLRCGCGWAVRLQATSKRRSSCCAHARDGARV